MKRLQLIAGLFAALACASVQAQTMDLRASIPFDFQLGKTLMPAGEYRISHESNGVLMVRQQDGRHVANMSIPRPASRAGGTAPGVLQFNRYGDTYFLAKVWAPNSRDGYALQQSPREKELASRTGRVETAGISLLRK